jgi:hypothetical protein
LTPNAAYVNIWRPGKKISTDRAVEPSDGERLEAGLLKGAKNARQSCFCTLRLVKMGELQQRMEERLKLEGYSYRTHRRRTCSI